MRRQHIAWDLGDDPAQDRADRIDRELRISDVLAFALLALPVASAPGTSFPLPALAMIGLVLLALTRVPPPDGELPVWLVLPLLGAWSALLLSDQLNGLDNLRRLGSIGIFIALAWVVANGRVSLPSAALGLGLSHLGVGVLALAGIGGDRYAGRLTGFFGDPNVAAFQLVVLGALAIGFSRGRWRMALLLAIPVLVVLTYSRTGFLAMGFGILWYLLGRRFGTAGGLVFIGALVWLIDNIPEQWRLIGPWAERSGSDLLRERIVAAEQELVASAPWYGHGPGTAQVELSDTATLFFHNSYLAARVEGGWPLLILLLLAVGVAFASLSADARLGDPEAIWCQIAIIGVLTMATTLGEVLFDLPTAVALGFATRTAMRRRRARPAEPPA